MYFDLESITWDDERRKKRTKLIAEEIDKKNSLRSSIWKCIEGKWKMIFHQGTLTKKCK